MMIFFSQESTSLFDGNIVAIPAESLIRVEQFENKITITYKSGEYDAEYKIPTIKIEKLEYQDSEFARLKMRKFYKACEKMSNVYFF